MFSLNPDLQEAISLSGKVEEKPKVKVMKKHSKGLKFERKYTTPGVSPFNEVEWETRDAVIQGEKGDKVFEQKGVEIPDSWSQQSTNIVVQKYFRGLLGSPERETSVRQLISRVSKTISDWGRNSGYFATPEDGDTFEAELTHLLLHQKMAFNSPVWFNVGIEPKPQCSACFILSIQDDIRSIMDVALNEVMVFKYGSGTGMNMSTLRSSKEHLTGGGKSSGPVVFMKGFDAFNGVIKAGGKTRRAAKMVILNADHPDILDFINCKAKEEKKAHVLIDAGFDSRLDGDVYSNIFFQNANHSVRVTDEFMKALEDDKDWQTKFVKTKEPADTYKAKDLMKQISEAAWFCGDPGLQFDTTINKWHTSPNSGRINASNPCVTGDTLIATSEGYRRIKDLVGKKATIIDGVGRESLATEILSTGTKDVYELKTKSGFALKLTADHKVLTANRGDVPAKDLREEDIIVLEKPGFGKEQIPIGMAEVLGASVGDGCVIESKEQRSVFITLAPEEVSVAEHLNSVLNSQKMLVAVDGRGSRQNQIMSAGATLRIGTSTPGIVEMLEEYAVLDAGSHLKCFKDRAFFLDRQSQAAILKGLFTTDGTVANYSDKSQYISLDSTSLELLQQVQLMLLGFGIKAKLYENRRAGKTVNLLPNGKGGMKEYQVREMYSLRISRRGRILFEKEIGFLQGSRKAVQLAQMNNTITTYAEDMRDGVKQVKYLGMEDVFDLTEPRTNHFVANGIVVHNCSEYMFLDDTACNLASLNLMKFRKENGEFDTESFKHAVEITITAQEIIVDNASYPTEVMTRNSSAFRPLGIGYANLGALLMANGLAYDSDEGRNYAAAITALMSGWAFRQSAVIAREMGPFKYYRLNEKPFLGVINMHRASAYMINHRGVQPELLEAARNSWDEAYQLGSIHGYKNSQISVLAPTGTISFLMDCDTTGVEPDIALVKYKWLLGGGMIKMVNQTVPEALKKLNYKEKEAGEILAHIEKNDTIEGAPHIREEHLSVFDCAFKPKNGKRFIAPMGHIKMMAAVQPFISGAISKTVNMPTDTTAEEITQAYVDAWKLGLKAIAIYRDGCKRAQPLTTSLEEKKKNVEYVAVPVRKKLPTERQAITHRFNINNTKGYITVGLYENGQPGEVFISIAKEGSTMSGLLGAFAKATSFNLQYGVPLKFIVSKFVNTRFEPMGVTDNKDIRFAKSLMDYLFRWLALKFLTKEDLEELGLTDGKDTLVSQNGNGTNGHSLADVKPEINKLEEIKMVDTSATQTTLASRITFSSQADAPACHSCGALMVRSGNCYKCINCGATSGCS